MIVDGNTTGLLTNGGVVSGFTEVPAATGDLMLTIESKNGQTLEQISLGSHDAGAMSVRWDGYNLMVDGDIVNIDRSKMNLDQYFRDENGEIVLDDNGDPIENVYPPGQYVFKLSGTIAGESEQLDMQMSSRVDSVTMSAGGEVTLNLTGGERANLDQIKQILDA